MDTNNDPPLHSDLNIVISLYIKNICSSDDDGYFQSFIDGSESFASSIAEMKLVSGGFYVRLRTVTVPI